MGIIISDLEQGNKLKFSKPLYLAFYYKLSRLSESVIYSNYFNVFHILEPTKKLHLCIFARLKRINQFRNIVTLE